MLTQGPADPGCECTARCPPPPSRRKSGAVPDQDGAMLRAAGSARPGPSSLGASGVLSDRRAVSRIDAPWVISPASTSFTPDAPFSTVTLAPVSPREAASTMAGRTSTRWFAAISSWLPSRSDSARLAFASALASAVVRSAYAEASACARTACASPSAVACRVYAWASACIRAALASASATVVRRYASASVWKRAWSRAASASVRCRYASASAGRRTSASRRCAANSACRCAKCRLLGDHFLRRAGLGERTGLSRASPGLLHLCLEAGVLDSGIAFVLGLQRCRLLLALEIGRAHV